LTDLQRGDLVTVVTSGDHGKPRPALIVQADAYALHPSITVLPLTSELHDLPLIRVTIEPTGKSDCVCGRR
jgi:mRNA interferase MazF